MKGLLSILTVLIFSVPAFGACPSTSGSSGNENWTTGTQSAAGGSTAIQNWTTVQGTTASIIANSGAPGSGWLCANVMKMGTNATQPQLSSYGTFPFVPQTTSGATTDLYFEFAYDNTTFNNFDSLLEVLTPGGSQAFIFNTFAGDFSVNQGGSTFNLTVNTYYLIHVHLQSGASSSYLAANGTTLVTFTENAADYSELVIAGGTLTANFYFGAIYFSSPGYPGGNPFPPTGLWDGHGGTNGTTVTAGYNGTIQGALYGLNNGVSSAPVTYAAGTGSEVMRFSTVYPCPSFASPLTFAQQSYSGNSGLSMDHYIPSGTTPSALVGIPLQTNYTSVAVGFCFGTYYSGTTTSFDGFGFAGGWIVNVCDSTSSMTCAGSSGLVHHLICIESEYSGTDVFCVETANNALVWITGNSLGGTAPVNDTVSIYALNSNGAVGSLLGTSSSIQGYAFTSGTPLYVGALGSESPAQNVDTIVGNMITETANASLPVLPPAAANGHCGACDMSMLKVEQF